MKEFQPSPRPYLEKMDPDNLSDVTKTAKLYAEVFAAPPWNEFTKCPSCFEFFGLDTKPEEPCDKCGLGLDLAYPEDQVLNIINKEVAKPGGLCFILKENSEVIGFTWGYEYNSPEEFAQEKYRTSRMRQDITGLLKSCGIEGAFFYYSECGVSQSRRGKGLSNILAEALLSSVDQSRLPMVMRTNWQSPMAAVAEKFGMKQIMGPKPIIDRDNKRILLEGGVVSNFTDSEIEERVLFIR